MKEIIKKTIKEHGLIMPGQRVLTALSGGSDSVCLLHVLKSLQDELDFRLYAAHLNHSIRPEADSDSRFVADLCKRLDIKCFIKKLDIRDMAKKRHISEELCGREERYKFFEEIAAQSNIDLIATAHNKNDTAETVLMHIIRGSGIDGQRGIAYKRGNIIRPLLDVQKADIESFCRENGYEFVTDKTNSETIYTRNRVRLRLIPMICRDFNPAFVDTLVRNSKIIDEDAEYLECEAKKLYGEIVSGGSADAERLRALPPAMARRVINIMYREFAGGGNNLQSVYCESIMKLLRTGASGKHVDLCNETELALEAKRAFFRKKSHNSEEFCYRLLPNVRVEIPEAGVFVTLTEWKGEGERFFFDDAERIFARSRRRGDVFYPTGMSGKKKLSDYFTDAKIPLSERNKIPIITYNDELVWVLGRRRDRRFFEGEHAYTFIIEKQGGEKFAEK